MSIKSSDAYRDAITLNVETALSEDIGGGDITAELIAADSQARARIITRQDAVIAGCDWVNAVFEKLDPSVKVTWHCEDGQRVEANSTLYELEGNARILLTGERTALNFLQLMSGIATRCARYANLVAHTKAKLLDTRKTIPGLRIAQKYAVTCGGCFNHRVGLFDAFLIKENHIAACGGIDKAIKRARENHPGILVEVEVENFEELQAGLDAGADRIMLDNFDNDAMRRAVVLVNGRCELEASGGITDETIVGVAETGVDFISLGTLTKDVDAVDLSMRLVE